MQRRCPFTGVPAGHTASTCARSSGDIRLAEVVGGVSDAETRLTELRTTLPYPISPTGTGR